MTACEKCKCEYEETEMVIPPNIKDEKIAFVCKECFELIKEEYEF